MTIIGSIPLTHMTEPGQWPAGSKVTLKLSDARSDALLIVMAMGDSMGRLLR